MIDTKDLEFWKEISVKRDPYDISSTICNFLMKKFDVELVSIYILSSDDTLKRLCLKYSKIDERQIENYFSHLDLPLKGSLAGYSILNNKKKL